MRLADFLCVLAQSVVRAAPVSHAPPHALLSPRRAAEEEALRKACHGVEDSSLRCATRRENRKAFSEAVKTSASCLRDSDRDEQTALDECMPSFFVLGSQKSGTSSLWAYLKLHPRVQLEKNKENLFLCSNRGGIRKPGCGMDLSNATEQTSYFASYLSQLEAPRHGRLSGEFTATNFACTCAPALLARRFHVRAKLIVLLRDPVQRALSRWREQRIRPVAYDARELNVTFQAFVADHLPKLQQCLERARGELLASAECARGENILGQSIYSWFAANWLSVFPREQMLFVQAESLDGDTRSTLHLIERFLGIPPFEYPHAALHARVNSVDTHVPRGERVIGVDGFYTNTSAVGQHKAPLETIQRLRAFYGRFQQNLTRLIGVQRIGEMDWPLGDTPLTRQ